MRILGVDPGLALTGWGIIERKDEPKLLDYGCIKTFANLTSSQRLLLIFDQFQKIIEHFHPDVICLEKLFFNTNAKTAILVGEARGVIKICTSLNNLKLKEFTPLQIKTTVVGYGRADKNQVQQMVKTLLGLKKIPKPDDAADGIAAALTYCYYNKSLK